MQRTVSRLDHPNAYAVRGGSYELVGSKPAIDKSLLPGLHASAEAQVAPPLPLAGAGEDVGPK